ncbi:hypothetical protein HJFPF1_07176 [Paramyrothecium foliicola]|nr:hypothetical protein HJFPF1_07176 [Paramyrothecium foliicola]
MENQFPIDIKDSSLGFFVALGRECREELGSGLRSVTELKQLTRNTRFKLRDNELVLADVKEL